MYALYWLVAAGVFIILEILTMGLTTIWFAGGALVAAIVARLMFPIGVQLLVFAVVSIILLLITRPLARHFVNDKAVKTNAESLVGQRCLVTSQIDNLHGEGAVTIRGLEWSARSVDPDLILPRNSIVKVESISGVKLMVSVVSIPDQVDITQ